MWTVYVLRSLKNGTRYVGSTNDLGRRLEEHARGHSKYTRNLRPLELAYSEIFEDRLAARRRERFLKSGRGREFLEGVIE